MLLALVGKAFSDRYLNKLPFGEGLICSDICPRTLSVLRSEQFSERVARGKL